VYHPNEGTCIRLLFTSSGCVVSVVTGGKRPLQLRFFLRSLVLSSLSLRFVLVLMYLVLTVLTYYGKYLLSKDKHLVRAIQHLTCLS